MGFARRSRMGLVGVVIAGSFMVSCGGDSPVAPADLADGFANGAAARKGKPDGGSGGATPWSGADAVVGDFSPADPIVLSSCSGSPGSNDTQPNVFWRDGAAGCVTVTPAGGYELGDDAQFIVGIKGGKVTSVQLLIQDIAGPAGIQHQSEAVPIGGSVAFTGAGFTLHVHADNVPVYRQKKHTGGPRVEMIGTISLGDVVYQ